MAKLTGATPLHKLAADPLVDALSGVQLVVYLRLLAAVHLEGSRRISIRNAQLYKSPRAAARALGELRDMGLVKIHHDRLEWQRAIEVT